MSSGVEANQKCTEEFKSLIKRTHSGVIYKINENYTSVEVEKTFPVSKSGSPKDQWEVISKDLPEDGCRYLVYDFNYEHQGIMRNRVLFVLWSPDVAKTRDRMVYASSRINFAKQLDGIQVSIEAFDRDDITYPGISQKLSKNSISY